MNTAEQTITRQNKLFEKILGDFNSTTQMLRKQVEDNQKKMNAEQVLSLQSKFYIESDESRYYIFQKSFFKAILCVVILAWVAIIFVNSLPHDSHAQMAIKNVPQII